jgi:imidazolonepropionase-like amidohydrolase
VIALLLAASTALGCDAILGARVHAPDGVHDGWDVAWDGGRITAVGPGAGKGCTARLRPGLEVTAGLVEAASELGIVEITLEQVTHDDAWAGDPVRAAHRVALAYDPRSVVLPVTRLGGITSAVVTPQGGLVSGQAAVVTLTTGSQHDAVVRPYAALVVRPDALGSKAAGLTRLRELLDDARVFAARRDPYHELSELSTSRLDLEALQPVLRREVPLAVVADRAADLEAWLDLAAEEQVRLVVLGGAEAWLVAPRLAAAGVPVIVQPFVTGAGSMDQVHGREDNAALLHATGVRVGIATFDTPNARSLRFVAGNAVRGGLDHEAAVDAITRVPAEAFGLVDRGVLRVGAIADLAVWTGDPLDSPGRLAGLFLAGVPQPLVSRQTALVDAWRTVPRRLWTDVQPSP